MDTTRDGIRKQFKVEGGIIRSPGEFEGCPEFIPYYWDLALSSCEDDQEVGEFEEHIAIFNLDATDVEAWPELAENKNVRIWKDDLGFVRFRIR